MSKDTALGLLNGVLVKIGEPTVADLTTVTGIRLVAWNAIQDAIIEVASMANWIPLEASSTFAMVTSTNTYAIATDMVKENIYSFRVPDNNDILSFLTPKEWNLSFPKGVTTDTQGYPKAIKREGGKFHLNKMPTSVQNGKKVHYDYWKRPTLLSTATATGTCWFPEGTDKTVLVNLATHKALVYKNSFEAPKKLVEVFGGYDAGVVREGTLETMKVEYSTPPARAKALVMYVF